MSAKLIFGASFAALLTVAAFAAGCTPIPPVATTPAPSTSAPATLPFTLTTAPITQEETITVTKPLPSSPASNPQVMHAIEDLAGRVGVAVDAITVISAEPVVWPDGALGCPQPGMEYIQVQQDGMKIILAVDGREYHYHSGETRGPFLCEHPADGG